MDRIPISVFLLKANQSAIAPPSAALGAFDAGDMVSRELRIEDMRARLWIGRSPGDPPDWVKHFGPMAGFEPNEYRASTIQGALAVRAADAEFLFTFGHAWRRVRTSKVVANFGLKCVLNLCRANNLRAIKHDRIAHDYVQTLVQSPEQADIHRFGIDIEQDLLRGVRAAVERAHGFGATVSGSDAFKFIYNPAEASLRTLLSNIAQIHRRKDYRRSFAWIDDIVPVRDDALISELTDELAAQIRVDPDAVTLCLPDFEGWESYDEFVFGRLGRSPVRSTLTLQSWLHHLRGEGISAVTADVLREQKIHAHFSGNSSIREGLNKSPQSRDNAASQLG